MLYLTASRYNSPEWGRFSLWINRRTEILNGDPQGVFYATPFSGSLSTTRCPTGSPTKEKTTRAGGPVCKTGSVFRPPRILMYSQVCRWAWECSSCRMMARIGRTGSKPVPLSSVAPGCFCDAFILPPECTFVPVLLSLTFINENAEVEVLSKIWHKRACKHDSFKIIFLLKKQLYDTSLRIVGFTIFCVKFL